MRATQKSGAITVQAIAGTHVVLFGVSVSPEAVKGLLGFSIQRTKQPGGEAKFLNNFLLFKQNDQGQSSDHSSEKNPFQAFVWGDYAVEPGQSYSYRVGCRYGTPGSLTDGDSASLSVSTESVDAGDHAIFFNRGAAASQAYSTEFPDQVGKRPEGAALTWLSRGLEEGLLAFIGQANGPSFSLRAAVYEFEYDPVLEAFGKAAQAGADVKIVWDHVDNSVAAKGAHKAEAAEPATKNLAAIEAAGIKALCVPREKTKQIPHNKFIVLLKDGVPQQVWTGSTNITAAGIYGQSNVGHAVRSPVLAADYLGYWTELSGDPDPPPLKAWTVADTKPPKHTPEELLNSPDPRPAPASVGTVFSPRGGNQALEWYAKLMDEATSSVFLTAAFGVSKELDEVFRKPKPYLRYLMLDNRNGKIDTVARGIEENPGNEVTSGAYIGEGPNHSGWHQWLKEALTGLDGFVKFIHTKYMLIDPLGDDPIVITGSANFSDASTSGNDENMLVIRGDTRVADIYLGEFMRLFTHFRLRGRANAKPNELLPAAGVQPDQPTSEPIYLHEDSSWTDAAYQAGSPEEKERLLFSGGG
jgi:phosphatidylserine/phosphatidylglycerophosphate/cardiolipin synthase-like enzyme